MVSKTEALKLIKEDEVIDVLRELVRRPSQNPPGNEKECAEYIASKMKDWGFEPQLIPEPYPNRPQVVVVYKGSEGNPKLALNGHMDVVPEGDLTGWSVDPYEGVVKEGWIYGRGACDMKAGIAAAMIAAKAVKDSGVRLRGNLILQFVIGEETGEPGTKTLCVDKGFGGDWGIVLEPSDLKVATAEKGLAWFHFEIKGKPCHASVPENGVNAIEKASKLISALIEYDREISKRTHPLCGRAICSVTMIKAGVKENIIPESCWIACDRRFIPGESADQVEKEIREIISRIREEDPMFNCVVRRKMVYESAEISPEHMIAEVVRKNVKEITGVMPEPYGTKGSTDQRNFINDAGIPAITWGPGWQKSHAQDESVEISKVVDAAKVLILTIFDLLK